MFKYIERIRPCSDSGALLENVHLRSDYLAIICIFASSRDGNLFAGNSEGVSKGARLNEIEKFN